MEVKSSTVDVQYFQKGDDSAREPGIAVVFSGGKAECRVYPLHGKSVEIGRAAQDGLTLLDPAMSRRHVRLSHVGGAFYAEDLGSKNGIVVDGRKIDSGGRVRVERVVRLGETVIITVEDTRCLRGKVTLDGDTVLGPALRGAYEAVDAIASEGGILHLRGETGTGKSLVAKRFHEARRREGGFQGSEGAFIGVKSGALGADATLKLLFGGEGDDSVTSESTSNGEGLWQAAHRGTLFLQDMHALDPRVQAALLGVFETGPAGEQDATLERCLVSASDRELRHEVAGGRFSEELFFRIGRPEVQLSPLRERLEEVPYHLEAVLAGDEAAPALTAGFVEACLLRRWPGNVRELRLEVKEAARRAGLAQAPSLAIEHLDKLAGRVVEESAVPNERSSDSSSKRIDKSMLPERDVILAILRETGGRVATAARQMGVHRNQLRRWLAENEVDPRQVVEP